MWGQHPDVKAQTSVAAASPSSPLPPPPALFGYHLSNHKCIVSIPVVLSFWGKSPDLIQMYLNKNRFAQRTVSEGIELTILININLNIVLKDQFC